MKLGIGELVLIFFVLVFTALEIFAAWKIVSKAGYNGALSLLALIPAVNIVMFFVFAFSEWPIHRELQSLRAVQGPIPPEAYKRA